MELTQIRYFLEVAESQHMTKSAEKLHISQPSLTQAIHRLEESLGVPLFMSKGRNIILTEYGKYLKKKLEPIVAELDLLPEQMKIMAKLSTETIHLNVLAASSIVTEAVIDYKHNKKNLNFQLMQNNESNIYDIEITSRISHNKNKGKSEKESYVEENNTEISKKRSDVVVNNIGESNIKENNIKINDIKESDRSEKKTKENEEIENYIGVKENEFVCEERIFLAVPNIDKYKDKKSISMADVMNEGFVSLAGSKQFSAICTKFCQNIGFKPKIIFESDNLAAVKNMIIANMGVGFWPEFTWGAIDEEHVKLLEIEDAVCKRDVIISYNLNKIDNGNVIEFFTYLKEYCLGKKKNS